MTRMTREFSLVLLGAGMLTAAYMMWPEPDQQEREKKLDEQAQARVGGRTHHSGMALLWIHSSGGRTGTVGSRPAGVASVSRGGFGGTAGRVGGAGA